MLFANGKERVALHIGHGLAARQGEGLALHLQEGLVGGVEFNVERVAAQRHELLTKLDAFALSSDKLRKDSDRLLEGR